MKTTVRFENAVTKLYKAFHAGELKGQMCDACAVGTICNNREEWDSTGLFHSGCRNEREIAEGFRIIKETGYSVDELVVVERLFMIATDNGWSELKEKQFDGLCAVVEYLCELDGIPNVMDFTSLFETENDQPKHELQTVF